MQNKITKVVLIVIGWISIALGVIGIVLPLLPTTPFILLAAACFAKSSKKFHFWLINHPLFGPIINNFQNGQGIPRHVKIKVIAFIWLTLSISMYFLPYTWARLIIFIMGIGLTSFLWRIPAPNNNPIKFLPFKQPLLLKF